MTITYIAKKIRVLVRVSNLEGSGRKKKMSFINGRFLFVKSSSTKSFKLQIT